MVCFQETPVGVSCVEGLCCPILVLLAFHALNMLLSGTAGYWIYTRHRKITLDFSESTEALAMGIAITMIPLSITNACLLTAYSNFKLSRAPQSFSYSESSVPLVTFNKKTEAESLRDELDKQKRENSKLKRTGIF